MENIIKIIVECDSLYGMICVIFILVFLYAIAHTALPFLYKCLCKICNTVTKFKSIHTKVDVDNVSVEADLHQ